MRATVILLGLAWTVWTGCFTPPAGRCSTTADCRDGYECAAGSCQAPGTLTSGSSGLGSTGAPGSSGQGGSSAQGSSGQGSSGQGSSAQGSSVGSSAGSSGVVVSGSGSSTTGTSSGVVNSSSVGAGSSSGVLTQTPAPLVRALCSFTNPQVLFELPPGAPTGATYSCRINNGAPAACMSPLDVTGLNVHQEATVEVVAQLPGLTASPAVSRMVRRGFNARGVGGEVKSLAVLPDESILVLGRSHGTRLEPSARGMVRVTRSGAFDPSQVGLLTGPGGGYANVGMVVHELTTAGLPTGKLLVSGNFDQFNGVGVSTNLTRLTSDGAPDPTWTGADLGTLNESVGMVVLERGSNNLPTGKLLVSGGFRTVDGNTGSQRLVRLLADGTVDPAWHQGGGFDAWVNMVLQVRDASGNPTGKLLVSGEFTEFDDAPCPRGLVMLQADGTLDPSFTGVGTGFNDWVGMVLQLRDSQGDYTSTFLVGGSFDQLNGNTVSGGVLRLLADGSPDPTFNVGGSGLSAYYGYGAYSLLDEEDGNGLPTGRIWVGGGFDGVYNGEYVDGNILRLNADGTRDNSTPAHIHGSVAYLLPLLRTDGSRTTGVFAVGNLSMVDDVPWSGPALLTAQGTLDTSFNPRNVLGDDVWTMTQRQDTTGAWMDGFHVAGSFRAWGGDTTGWGMVRLLANGEPDTTFNSALGRGVEGEVRNVMPELDAAGEPNGKLWVVGWFGDALGVDVSDGIMRLNANMTRDAVFNAGGLGLYDGNAFAVLPVRDASGQLGIGYWVAHGAEEYNTNSIPGGILRVQPNGYRDATFNPAGFGRTGGYTPMVTLLVPELSTAGTHNGKMLAAGYFESFNGMNVPYGLVRLNPDGTLDQTFNPGGTGLAASELAVFDLVQERGTNGLPTGRWLVGAQVDTYNGTRVRGAFRILENGSLDPSFELEMYSSQRVRTLLQERDSNGNYTGNWFVGGAFGTIQGGAINVPDNFMRVDANGAWDPTFLTDQQGFDDEVVDMVAETRNGVPTGNIILLGYFTAFNAQVRLGLARVLPDGTLDEFFHGDGRGP